MSVLLIFFLINSHKSGMSFMEKYSVKHVNHGVVVYNGKLQQDTRRVMIR